MIKDLSKEFAKTYTPYTGEHGLYVSRTPDLLSVDKLVNMVHMFKLCTMDDKDINKLHCTIIYSPNPVHTEAKDDMSPVVQPCSAWVKRVELWPGHDDEGYLVACLESDVLQTLHRLWRLRGGVPTFPEYQPHITLKSPFEEYRGLTRRLKDVNRHLEEEPLLIRLTNETVEDIKKKTHVSAVAAYT